ncbi:MAG: histone deacetylase [Bacteroidales bacterium]|nr:histone deacetylase [Bacteroidales bacterium]
MKVLFNSKFLDHNVDSEAEGAYRIEQFPGKYEDRDRNGEEYITLVHTENYKQLIKEGCLNNETLAEIQLSPESYEAALSAVGLTVHASEYNGFAVVRPPGHHAGRERAAGFCLFNNIAIATQKLVNEGKKVAIIDIDAHHGNGTQEIFYESDKVFYISFHQAFTYPHTGQAEEAGKDKGKGYTLNIPLMLGSDDKVFLSTMDKTIQTAKNFQPDIVAISAGFDGYYKDKMMNFDFSLKAYYECGFKLGRAFKNNIFAVLEGGYHEDIYQCVTNFVEGVNVGSRPVRNRFDFDMSIG